MGLILGGVDRGHPVDWGDTLNVGLLAWWRVMPWNVYGDGRNGTLENLTKYQGDRHDGQAENDMQFLESDRPGSFGCMDTGTSVNSRVNVGAAHGQTQAGRFNIESDDQVSETREITISAWVKNINGLGDSSDGRVITKDSGTAEAAHVFMLSGVKSGTPQYMRFRLKVNGTTDTLLGTSGPVTDDGLWHHWCAMLRDENHPNAGRMRLYYDGVLVDHALHNTAGPISSNQVGKDTCIGTSTVGGGGGNPWGGQLDDIRIWNRALLDEEVLQITHEINPYAHLRRVKTIWSPAAVINEGTVEAEAQSATASLIGIKVHTGTVVAESQNATTELIGESATVGTVEAQAQDATASLIGTRVVIGTVVAESQNATTELVGGSSTVGTVEAQAQDATASLIGTRVVNGTVVAESQDATAELVGENSTVGTVAAQAQDATAELVGTRVVNGAVAAQAQDATAELVGEVITVGVVAAQAQDATAELVGIKVHTGTVVAEAQNATTELVGTVGSENVGTLVAVAQDATTLIAGEVGIESRDGASKQWLQTFDSTYTKVRCQVRKDGPALVTIPVDRHSLVLRRIT